MKKTLLFSLMVAITATIGTLVFQSCNKDIEVRFALTAETLVADADFQTLALSFNEIQAKFAFFDANISSEKRKSIRDELSFLCKTNPKPITQNDLLRVTQILGYNTFDEFKLAYTNYTNLYSDVQKKYEGFDNFSAQAYQQVFSEASMKFKANLPWKLSKDSKGVLQMIPTKPSLRDLGTVQLRSCNCNFPDCNRDFNDKTGSCDRDLARDLRDMVGMAGAGAAAGFFAGGWFGGVGAIPGSVAGFTAGGILGLGVAAVNYADCNDAAIADNCACIKSHNHNCACN